MAVQRVIREGGHIRGVHGSTEMFRIDMSTKITVLLHPMRLLYYFTPSPGMYVVHTKKQVRVREGSGKQLRRPLIKSRSNVGQCANGHNEKTKGQKYDSS